MQPAPLPKPLIWTGRVLSVLCVLFLLMDGVVKLMNIPEVTKICVELGIPENAIVGIGIVLLGCTVLYAIPATSVLGAILLTGYFGGAIMTHVRVGGPVFSVVFPIIIGVLVWLGLFLRDARLHGLIPLRSSSKPVIAPAIATTH